MKDLIIQQVNEFWECSCGEYNCNPFRCVKCGKRITDEKSELTFLEVMNKQDNKRK